MAEFTRQSAWSALHHKVRYMAELHNFGSIIADAVERCVEFDMEVLKLTDEPKADGAVDAAVRRVFAAAGYPIEAT